MSFGCQVSNVVARRSHSRREMSTNFENMARLRSRIVILIASNCSGLVFWVGVPACMGLIVVTYQPCPRSTGDQTNNPGTRSPRPSIS